MPHILILIPCLILGTLLAMWGRFSWTKQPQDQPLYFLGMVLGSIIAWSTMEPVYAIGILVIVPLIIRRHRKLR